MSRILIGVDVGGTKVAAARVADRGALDAVELPTNRSSPEDVIIGIESAVRRVIERCGSPQAVGVGVPSQVDARSGTVLSSVNIPLAGVALAEELTQRLDAPVFVDNDGNCAALAEARIVEVQHLVMYTLGTGVGGGVVIDGAIFRGASGLAPELGHAVVQADGPECPGACPNHGCLEALCSGTALERDARAFAREHPDSALGRRAAEADRELSGRDVLDLAREGDADSRGLLEDLGRWLGVGLASAVNTFEPQRIAIGGGLSRASDFFLETALDEARSRALPALAERVEIALAHSGPDAGLVGAGLLASDELDRTGERA